MCSTKPCFFSVSFAMMRHSFLHADTKNRFPRSRPWLSPCAGTKGAFAVPPGLKRSRARRKSSAAPIFFAGSCAVRLLRRRLTPPARRAADGVRNVCAVGRKLPARPAKPGDTNALWRAAALQTSWRKRGPNCPGLYAAGREPEGGGFRLGGLASAGAERVFTFVCAGYRGRAVGDWPRERKDGERAAAVTALAAEGAALLPR